MQCFFKHILLWGKTWTLTGISLDPADGEIKISLDGNLLGSGDYTLNNSSGETKITFNSAVPFYSAKRDDNDKSNSTINMVKDTITSGEQISGVGYKVTSSYSNGALIRG